MRVLFLMCVRHAAVSEIICLRTVTTSHYIVCFVRIEG